MPTPTGTGFFVSADGLFVTARHVIADTAGQIRTDITGGNMWLEKEIRDFAKGPLFCEGGTVLFDDQATDTAVLRFDFAANKDKQWLSGKKGFPYIRVASRVLEEGEPVYAFGYPLPSASLQSAPPGISVGTITLRPRVTSAIVSSTIEEAGMIQSNAPPGTYVLDKALNYGNSGGPILAATGHAYAICTRFQPVQVRQPQLDHGFGGAAGWIMIPSLYGIVTALTTPAIADFLRKQGVNYV